MIQSVFEVEVEKLFVTLGCGHILPIEKLPKRPRQLGFVKKVLGGPEPWQAVDHTRVSSHEEHLDVVVTGRVGNCLRLVSRVMGVRTPSVAGLAFNVPPATDKASVEELDHTRV